MDFTSAYKYESVHAWLPWQPFGDPLSLAVFGAAVVVWCVGVRAWRRRHPARDHPSCARCGYDVRSLPTDVCPECGGDLRRGGTLPAAMAVPVPAGWSKLGWAAVLFSFAVWVTPLCVRHQMLPRLRQCSGHMNLSAPVSGQFREAGVSFSTIRGFEEVPPLSAVWVGVDAAAAAAPNVGATWVGARWEVHVYHGGNAWVSVVRDGKEGKENRRAVGGEAPEVVIPQMVAGIGVDTSSPAVVGEMEDLRDAFLDTLSLADPSVRKPHWPPGTLWAENRPRHFGGVSRGITVREYYPVWYAPLVAVFWLVIWGVGVRRITRKRKGIQC